MNYRVIYTFIYIVDSVVSSKGRWHSDIDVLGVTTGNQLGPTH